jgi:hypothetical protein
VILPPATYWSLADLFLIEAQAVIPSVIAMMMQKKTIAVA